MCHWVLAASWDHQIHLQWWLPFNFVGTHFTRELMIKHASTFSQWALFVPTSFTSSSTFSLEKCCSPFQHVACLCECITHKRTHARMRTRWDACRGPVGARYQGWGVSRCLYMPQPSTKKAPPIQSAPCFQHCTTKKDAQIGRLSYDPPAKCHCTRAQPLMLQLCWHCPGLAEIFEALHLFQDITGALTISISTV